MTKQYLMSVYNFGLLDQMILQQGITPLSLNPNKNLITSFRELGNIVLERVNDSDLVECIFKTLEYILNAQLSNFPENIFWDYDFMIHEIIEQAISAKEEAITFLESFAKKLVELMEMFGCSNEIRFRYVHDFTYGFDWARWVKKDPVNRANIRPFNVIFLDYLLNKGKEILQKISVDDIRYRHISERSYRNPFRFPRDPKDEYRLLTYLAGYQLIPVATWNWNGGAVWDKPFDQLREQASMKLFVN
ncbi:MAG: hypothetical protein IGS39_06805 [Calothrix sp. C42_A2020_038]|nr:hypothetical protein [Calothrix sp. C42_A2020_038]